MSNKELVEVYEQLSDRLDMLMTQTMHYAASEMHGSANANTEGDRVMKIIKEIIGEEGSLEDFLKIVPVRNAVYAGAFSLDTNLDHVVVPPVLWLTLLSGATGGLTSLTFFAYLGIMRSVGRASLIADMGLGRSIGFWEAINEARMLARREGALGLAQQGHTASLVSGAKFGRWVGRVSIALAVLDLALGIASIVVGSIRSKNQRHELEKAIAELKEAIMEVFPDRANFFYDDLQMQSLISNLWRMGDNLEDDQEKIDRLETYDGKKAAILDILGKTRKRLVESADKNQKQTQADLSALDAAEHAKTQWDPPWSTVKYTHDVDIAIIRVVSTGIVEAIQCVFRDGSEGLIYGGAARFENAPKVPRWWTDEIKLKADETIVSAVWKKTHVSTLPVRNTTISGTAVWDLRISTNKGQLPPLGSGFGSSSPASVPTMPIYYGDFNVFESDGFVRPEESIIWVNKQAVDSSYTVTELIDANVTMEKKKDQQTGELDVVVHNTNFIQNLKFVIEMKSEPPPSH